MTTTTIAPRTTRRPLWSAALASGVAAAVVTAAAAGLAGAAGVSLDVDGEPIPVSGFAVMTLMAVAVGYVLALAIGRFAARPHRTFTVTTAVLTAMSIIPDLTFPMATETRPVLVATHLVAAAIVIPALARRLPAASEQIAHPIGQ